MEDITRMILEKGVERRSNLLDSLVSAKNQDGKDPLHYARESIMVIVDEIRGKENKEKIAKRLCEEDKQRE